MKKELETIIRDYTTGEADLETTNAALLEADIQLRYAGNVK